MKSLNASILVIVFLSIAAFSLILIYLMQIDKSMQGGKKSSQKQNIIVKNESVEEATKTPKEEVAPQDDFDKAISEIDSFSVNEVDLTSLEDEDITSAGSVNTSEYLNTYDESKF